MFSQSRARLAALRQTEDGSGAEIAPDYTPEYAPTAEKSFFTMVRDGLAYSLPGFVLALLLLLAFLALRH